MAEPIPVVAIDGTAGSGKGTLARGLAQVLGWHYLDSGALYRACAHDILRQEIAIEDMPACVAAAQAMELDIQYLPEGLMLYLSGSDISTPIRSSTVGAAASIIAGYPEIRAALLPQQHAARQAPGLVADGRDMGSVVFPDACLKVFLTASLETRAQRRQVQLKELGVNATIAALIRELTLRDQQDMQRSAAPLIQTPDAFLLDTTEYSIEEVCNQVRARLPGSLTPTDKGTHL